MKAFRSIGVVALAAFAFAACDDEDSTGVDTVDLEGSWSATTFAYTDAENPSLTLDAVEDAGGTVTLNVAQSGAFTGEVDIPTVTPGALPIGGTITVVDENTLFVDFNASTEVFFDDFEAEFQLDGDVLTWANHDAAFDFPDSVEEDAGIGARGEVAAILSARFTR